MSKIDPRLRAIYYTAFRCIPETDDEAWDYIWNFFSRGEDDATLISMLQALKDGKWELLVYP